MKTADQAHLEARKKWLERIEQWERSGKNLRSWCLEHDISYPQCWRWRRWLRENGFLAKGVDQNSFSELKDTSSEAGVRIEREGIFIHLEKDFDPGTLRSCLQLLKELGC